MVKKKCFVTCLLLFVLLASCTKIEPKSNIVNGNVFGTKFTIIYKDAKGRNFENEIDSLFHLVNKSLSTYMPSSDISKINNGDKTIVVDAMFKEVFQKADRIYKETDGVFDPTIGVLVNAWGFGPKKKEDNLDSLRIKQLLTYVGFDKVKLVNGKIEKLYPETYFDFNAIAKGYGVDVIATFFENQNVKNYMVEIGGEVRVRGVNDSLRLWRIGIQNPDLTASSPYQKVISLENEAMATSGNYRKFRIDPVTGEKYVHTLDTKTGYTAKRDLLSASVVASLDCADVDGYATAFMAMGFEKTTVFLKKHPELKVLLVYIDKEGATKEYKTENLTSIEILSE